MEYWEYLAEEEETIWGDIHSRYLPSIEEMIGSE